MKKKALISEKPEREGRKKSMKNEKCISHFETFQFSRKIKNIYFCSYPKFIEKPSLFAAERERGKVCEINKKKITQLTFAVYVQILLLLLKEIEKGRRHDEK